MNFLGSEHDDLIEEADRDLVEEGEVLSSISTVAHYSRGWEGSIFSFFFTKCIFFSEIC